MILVLLATILVVAIAFFQATQGFYSAMIMAVLSLVSALVAFNYYEPLAAMMYSQQPTLADAVALLVLFVVLLLGLRLAADHFLHRNVVLGLWANRIGGGTLGLLTGMILVGVLAVALQMLPWGPSVLGYKPFDDSLQRTSRLLLFAPDDFVLGTMDVLSGESLAGASTHPFGNAHDDLLLELFCARNTAGRNGRTDTPTGVLSVDQAYASDGAWGRDVPSDPRLGDRITKVVVVRATVNRGATDKDGWWRLPGTHFRLVGKGGRSYYPVWYLARTAAGAQWVTAPSEEGRLQVARVIVERKAGKENALSVDWVYRVPADEEGLDAKGMVMVFRRICRDNVPKPASRFPDLVGGLEIELPPPAE
ncbi:MAG: CvpA family protein [Phycisphaerae bacterium]|nr:CvpA family protein [Phycisphaerae bacterium]